MFIFSEFCLSQKTFYYRKLIVFSCLQFADCLHMIKNFLLCSGVIFAFNHFLRNLFLWKVSFETALSWCCRKHVFVFEIVSLNGLNECMIKLSLSLWLLGKRFQFAIIEKVLKTFPFWALTFFFFWKVKLWNLGGWLCESGPWKGVNVLAFLDTSWSRGV